MDRVVVLFLIGIIVGILVPFAERNIQPDELIENPLGTIAHVFVAASKLWHFIISILVLITLPTVIFKSIRNRLHQKEFFPLPFMTGLSFGFTFMALIGLIVSSFTL